MLENGYALHKQARTLWKLPYNKGYFRLSNVWHNVKVTIPADLNHPESFLQFHVKHSGEPGLSAGLDNVVISDGKCDSQGGYVHLYTLLVMSILPSLFIHRFVLHNMIYFVLQCDYV